jgi:hypothetical protein
MIFQEADLELSPEEYAALWGCDPQYDRPPRQRGDGYLFYNYAVEQDDPEFLRRFLGAIGRTVEGLDPNDTDHETNKHNLEALREYMQEQLAVLDKGGIVVDTD